MITLEQRLNILNSAIKTFGKEKQKVVAIEELAELQKNLTKDLRGKPNLQKIAEEIAKVHRYNCFGHKNFGYDNYQRIVELCTQAYTYMPSERERVLGAPKLYTSPWTNGLWCATVNGYKVV